VSYDVDLTIDTGGPDYASVFDVGNYTSDVAPMWDLALGRPLYELHNWNAEDVVPDLDRAIAAMRAAPAVYEALNPSNGWGDYEGALAYLERLREGCVAHPKTYIRVSR
jgi:hypothetical protein